MRALTSIGGGAFYWNSADNRSKYRLVKWQSICRPKTHGGLGILNTSIMNKCLIIKWWWKIVSSGSDSLWYSLLKGKNFPNCNPLFASPSGGSQFWRDLVKVRDDFRAHVKFVVGNGTSTRFLARLVVWRFDFSCCFSDSVLLLLGARDLNL